MSDMLVLELKNNFQNYAQLKTHIIVILVCLKQTSLKIVNPQKRV